MSQEIQIKPSLLAYKLAESIALEELESEKSISLKENYIRLIDQLEIDGVPKEKISAMGKQIIIERKKIKLDAKGIINENHTVPDKHVILYGDSFANEGVTRNLAFLPNLRILLDFHEGTDFGLIPDFTAVQIDEFGKLNVGSELYVGRNASAVAHNSTKVPGLLTDVSAASSILTIRKPASPSLNGFLLFVTQSTK